MKVWEWMMQPVGRYYVRAHFVLVGVAWMLILGVLISVW
jgi:hypothetical protein